MTIDQTEVIIAAFEREIAKHKASLEANEQEWDEEWCFDLDVFNSMCKEKDRIAIWEHAAAIVRRVAGEVKK